MSLKEIKEDLISQAKLLLYQMKEAQKNTNYDLINNQADLLADICKKLEIVRQEEERLHKEYNF